MAYVRTRLGRLFYEEWGGARGPRDPAIVLLHGLLFDGSMWRAQVPPLAELGRVIVLDGPGHGKSEPAPRFVLEEHADALFDAFGELGVRRSVVVGLSWGGMVGMRLALQHPEKVVGLALLDTSADSETLAKRLKFRTLIALHRRVGIPPKVFRTEVAPLLFAPGTLATQAELVEDSYRRAMGFDRGGLARAAIAVVVHRTSIVAKLPKVAVPTLVLCGSEDASCPPRESETIASGIAGARLVILDGLGHMSAIEAPARVNEHVVPFVDETLATTRDLPSSPSLRVTEA
jgi:3-oxoadipate enol-lactonase